MSDHTKRLAGLSVAFAIRQEEAERLWAWLKEHRPYPPSSLKRYYAYMRLCEWMQKRIRELV